MPKNNKNKKSVFKISKYKRHNYNILNDINKNISQQQNNNSVKMEDNPNESMNDEGKNEEYYNSKKEQLNILKTNLKFKEDKIQNYEIQIEDYKNSKITLETKLNHITNSLNKTKNKIKKKEKLNSDLFSEINNLKKLLKENNYNPSNKSLMEKIITKETGTNSKKSRRKSQY